MLFAINPTGSAGWALRVAKPEPMASAPSVKNGERPIHVENPVSDIVARQELAAIRQLLNQFLNQLLCTRGVAPRVTLDAGRAAVPDLSASMEDVLSILKAAGGPVGLGKLAGESSITEETIRRWCNPKNGGHLYRYGVRNKGNKQGYYYDKSKDLSLARNR